MSSIKETEDIFVLLSEKISPIKGTGLVYPIARNLKNIKAFFTDLDEDRKTILEKFTEKDAEGKVIEYVFKQNEETKQFDLALDSEGNFIKASEETINKGGKLDYKNPDFVAAMKDWSNVKFDNFYKVDIAKLTDDQLALLDGINIEPLLDTVFFDSREK